MSQTLEELIKKVEQLRLETGVKPKDPHPSEWEEIGKPQAWAMKYFENLPAGILDAVRSEERDYLIPAKFGSNPSILEKAFFNQSNIDILHKAILKEVKDTYRYKISRQSDESVHNVMVSVFDRQMGRFNENVYRIKSELLAAIQVLDAFTLEDAVKVIVREIQDYMLDRKYWENNPVPELPLPLYEKKTNQYQLDPQKFYLERPKTNRVKAADLSSVGVWPL